MKVGPTEKNGQQQNVSFVKGNIFLYYELSTKMDLDSN